MHIYNLCLYHIVNFLFTQFLYTTLSLAALYLLASWFNGAIVPLSLNSDSPNRCEWESPRSQNNLTTLTNAYYIYRHNLITHMPILIYTHKKIIPVFIVSSLNLIWYYFFYFEWFYCKHFLYYLLSLV